MREKLETLSLVQLRELAKEQDLKVTGLRKKEVINLLVEAAEKRPEMKPQEIKKDAEKAKTGAKKTAAQKQRTASAQDQDSTSGEAETYAGQHVRTRRQSAPLRVPQEKPQAESAAEEQKETERTESAPGTRMRRTGTRQASRVQRADAAGAESLSQREMAEDMTAPKPAAENRFVKVEEPAPALPAGSMQSDTDRMPRQTAGAEMQPGVQQTARESGAQQETELQRPRAQERPQAQYGGYQSRMQSGYQNSQGHSGAQSGYRRMNDGQGMQRRTDRKTPGYGRPSGERKPRYERKSDDWGYSSQNRGYSRDYGYSNNREYNSQGREYGSQNQNRDYGSQSRDYSSQNQSREYSGQTQNREYGGQNQRYESQRDYNSQGRDADSNQYDARGYEYTARDYGVQNRDRAGSMGAAGIRSYGERDASDRQNSYSQSRERDSYEQTREQGDACQSRETADAELRQRAELQAQDAAENGSIPLDARTGRPVVSLSVGEQSPEISALDSGKEANGILEVMSEGFGFIRCENFLPGENDVYVAPSQIRRFNLKTGDIIRGNRRIKTAAERFAALLYITSVNGMPVAEAERRPAFENLTPIFPDQRIQLEAGDRAPLPLRVMDLLAPIGKGQRGMIVSPPKAGKTTLLKQAAKSIIRDPNMHLIILLIDERPEEVTDIKEEVVGENVEVIYSTFDELPDRHKRVSEMVIERAKRLVEYGKDVTILLDSITRLARAYNLVVPPSGRTLSGGLDPAALHMPKRFFGAARNMREGGSLTILATALIDTGSRMDDVIYEEFKGTGNMELVLDRKLSERRIFPAIDILKSGTRRDDLLLSREELEAVTAIRKAFSTMKSEEAVEKVLDLFSRTKNNRDFVAMAGKIKFC